MISEISGLRNIDLQRLNCQLCSVKFFVSRSGPEYVTCHPAWKFEVRTAVATVKDR